MANKGYAFATICGVAAKDPREITGGRSEMATLNVMIEKETNDGKTFTQYLDVFGYGFMAKRILDNFREGDAVVAHGELSQKKYQKKDGSTGFSVQVNVSNGSIETGGSRETRRQDRDDRRESRRDDRDHDRDRARDDRDRDRDRPPANDSRYEKDDDDPFDN